MTLREMLSADMPTVRRWLGEGWRWWLDQMSAMAPVWAKRRRHRGPVLERAPDDPCGWRVAGTGQSARMLSARRKRLSVVALDPSDVLCRTIEAPVLGRADLRQMLAFDIDRIGPFPAAAVCFDEEVVGRDQASMAVRIGMVPVTRLRSWLEPLRAQAIEPARIAMRDEAGALHFDFLRALGEGRADNGAWRWWSVVALLFLLNVGALIWRDIVAVERLREAVEEQAPAGRTALLIRGRLQREQARHIRLVRERERFEPLRAIAAVSAAMPAGAWVQRFEWNGEAVRLVGYAPGTMDVGEALRESPRLRAVSENDAEGAPPNGADQMRAFDIQAALARP